MSSSDVAAKVKSFFSPYPNLNREKGEILVHAGEDPKYIIYLLKGHIEQYDISSTGEKIVVNIFKPGAFFPMSWAINKTANTYFYEAASDIQAKTAPAGEVVDFIKANSDVAFDLLSRVYTGVDGLLRHNAQLMGGTARNRLLSEIFTYAKRFGEVQKNGMVAITISEAELGSQVGLSRETVNREISQLKKDGLLIKEHRRIIIPDLNSLKDTLNI